MSAPQDQDKRRFPLAFARIAANRFLKRLESYCWRIEVAGSIRRCKSMVGDIELLCIPMRGYDQVDLLDWELQTLINAGLLGHRLGKTGQRIGYGPQNKFLVDFRTGMPLDVFSTTEEGWAMSLVVRTGPKELNVRLMKAARDRGMKGHAYGTGFTLADGSPLVCRTEEDVFAAVGWRYIPPQGRG